MPLASLVVAIAALSPSAAFAQSPAASPAAVKPAPGASAAATIKAAVEGTIAAIGADPVAKTGDPARTATLVRANFLPYTDFSRTARLAVGEDDWQKASEAQRQAIVSQFETLLVRVYAAQLTQIQGKKVSFKFDTPTAVPHSSDVVIGSAVHTDTDDMTTRYRLAKTANGFKIYDIDLMGLWLVQVYKQQFAAQLRQGGIDGLIKYLTAHNAG